MQKQLFPFIIKHWCDGAWHDTGERWSSLCLAQLFCKYHYKDCCVFLDEAFLNGSDFIAAPSFSHLNFRCHV